MIMTPKYDKIHNKFKLNGIHFSHEDLKEVAYSLVKEGEPYEKVTGNFLMDWLNKDDFLYVKTSGSTGKPKNIKLNKQAMVNSAIATGDYFGLEPGDKALDCLPSHYIAGKMMLVRAMILGLELDIVEPSTHPMFDYAKTYKFCAMIPLQLKHVIKYTHNIHTIIVGGSKITTPLLDMIRHQDSEFYETYGMTETITHVAARQLESKKAKHEVYFKALPNIIFSQDDRNCLVIEAPHLLDEPVTTNDVVDLISDTSFDWLGRIDNVVNSGAVKLFPEQIEGKLQTIIDERFIVGSEPDDTLGEKLILVIENPRDSMRNFEKRIKYLKGIRKFEIPKNIYFIDEFEETVNGKVQRKATIKKALAQNT